MEKKRLEGMSWHIGECEPCKAKIIKCSKNPTLIIDMFTHGKRIRAAVNKDEMGFFIPDENRWEEIPYKAFGTCFLADAGIETGTATETIQTFIKNEMGLKETDWVHGLHTYYLRQRYQHHYWHNNIQHPKKTKQRMDLISFFNLFMVKEIPAEFLQWARDRHPSYFLYTGKKADREITWRCSNCGHTESMPGKRMPKLLSNYTCPHCGKTLIVRRDGTKFEDEKGIALIQRTKDNGFVERTFNIMSHKTENGAYEMPDIQESYRFFIEPDGTWYEFHKNPYKSNKEMDYWFDSSHFNMYNYNLKWYYPAYWTGNLTTELKGTAWQYSAVDLYVKDLPRIQEMCHYNRLNICAGTYCLNFYSTPEYEYLVKTKMYACMLEHMNNEFDFVSHQGKPWERFGISKDEFLFMKNNNLAMSDVRISRKIGMRNSNTFIEAHKLFAQLSILLNMSLAQKYRENLIRLVHGFQSGEMAMGYLTRQKEQQKCEMTTVLDTLNEYYDMASGFHIRLDHRFTYAPNNLMDAHSRLKAAKTLIEEDNDWCGDQKKRDIYRRIEEVYNEIRDIYEYSDGEYSIIVPQNAAEILADSYLLGHCVAKRRNDYFQNIVNRVSYIMFLRQSPDEPFYTFETNAGSSGIIEQRTFYNSRLPNDAFFKKFGAFIKKWQAHVKEHMTEKEHTYWLKSTAYQYSLLAEYRRKHEKVRGNSVDSGKQLADVLEDNYIEPVLSEKELIEQTLIKTMFTFDLTDPVPVKSPMPLSA